MFRISSRCENLKENGHTKKLHCFSCTKQQTRSNESTIYIKYCDENEGMAMKGSTKFTVKV